MIGRVLDGRYRIDARIARGGTATVFRARDLRLDRPCAVKVMHPDLDDHDPATRAFAARFVREAHAAARLSHPDVVAVTDQGDDDGALFLVMELVEGGTLRDVLRDEAPMDPERALELLEPTLCALAEAHRCGIVHRDVKPENVLIADDGRVKVTDFGLARAFDADTQHSTTGGLLMGTVSYLAPELIADGRADGRSDVYAAGVLLFEMLTGRKPHEGEGAIQIAFKHVNEDVPAPSSVIDRPLPAYLDALVLCATARQRERRPADAQVLLRHVRRVRAAIEAGETDDPDLTSDLLRTAPPVPAVPAAPAAWTAAAGTGSGMASATGTLEDALDPVVDDDEPTQVLGPRGSLASTVVDRPRGAAATGAPGTDTLPGSASGTAGTVTEDPPRPDDTQAPRRAQASAPRVRPNPPTPPLPGVAPPGGTGARPARPARRRRPPRGPLLLVVAVLATALLATTVWWFGIGRYTSTPGIINLPLPAATTKLEQAGLDVEVSERVFSETVAAGSVIRTEPGAGDRVLDGGTVRAVVSKGPERYEVPALAGKRFKAAEPRLAQRNLELGDVRRVWHDKVDKGVVIAARPRAGTELRRGDTVDVTVSRGREPLKIPDLSGRPGGRAETRLSDIGFEVVVTERHDDVVPKGRVVAQTPSTGTGFRGDQVEVVVSLGPVMVDVPGLRTLSIEDATLRLEEIGLRIAVERTSLYVGLDRVVRQDPDEGTSIPRGDVVTVSVV